METARRPGMGAAVLLACLWVLAFGCAAPSVVCHPCRSGLLMASDPRWVGGDGAFSVPLEGGGHLWLFGDTWLATPNDGINLVSNTLGIQSGPCDGPIIAFWREEAGRPAAAFSPGDGRGWLWPAGGLCLEGYLHLFFHQMERREPGGAWDFFPRGTELIRVMGCRGPPEAWGLDRVTLPWGEEKFLLGSAPIIVGSHVLAYGSRPTGSTREIVLARIHVRDLLELRMERWEYFEGYGQAPSWTSSVTRARGLFHGIGTEFTVIQRPDGQWICLYSPDGISPEVHLRRAPHPHGPWGHPVRLYRCPEEEKDPNLYCYGAKLHPQCMGDDRKGLWITYTVNTKDSSPPRGDEAKPRWVLITCPEQ